jgi:hypothetical protein
LFVDPLLFIPHRQSLPVRQSVSSSDLVDHNDIAPAYIGAQISIGQRDSRMQIERTEWRPTMAGCKVIIHQHLDTTLTLMIAGHRVGHYSAEGKLSTPLTKKQIKAVEKTLRGKVTEQIFPLNLRIPQTTRNSHFPTASTTADD